MKGVEAYLTKDDEIVCTFGGGIPNEVHAYMREHRDISPDIYGKPQEVPTPRQVENCFSAREITIDHEVPVALFKNDEGDILLVEDRERVYSPHRLSYGHGKEEEQPHRGDAHPTELGYFCVGHTAQVGEHKAEEEVPFYVTSTRAYFTHTKNTKDLRYTAGRYNSIGHVAGKDITDEEFPPEKFIMHSRDSRNNHTKWLYERLTVNVKL